MTVDALALCMSLLQCFREQEANALDSTEARLVAGVGLSGQGSGYVLSRRPFSKQGAPAGQRYELALVLPTPRSVRNVGAHC